MIATRRPWVLGLFLLLGGVACHRKPTTSDADATLQPTSPGLSATTPPTPPLADEGPSDADALPAGPAADGAATSEERQRVVTALLSGSFDAQTLPESATDPGRSFDRGLRKRLTIVEVPAGEPVPSPTPRGVVEIRAAKATVPLANQDRALAVLRSRLRTCYQASLSATAAPTGRLVLVAKVDAAGAVTSVAVTNTDLPTSVADCSSSALRHAKFDPPESPSTLTVPVDFSVER